jgi:ABC-2 type transport system permease protein
MLRVESTIAWLTARQLLARRRGVPVLLLALIPVAVAALFRMSGGEDATGFALTTGEHFVVRIVLPLIALVFGTGAMGAERDEGTAIYLLTRPVPRWRVALTKLITAATLTAALVVPSSLLTSLVALGGTDQQGIALGFAAGVAAGSVLYTALFVALGIFVRRALAVGLLYVVAWEVAAAQMFAGTRTLSIRQYVLTFADRYITAADEAFSASLDLRTALLMSAAVLVVAGVLAVHRLGSFEVIDQQ